MNEIVPFAQQVGVEIFELSEGRGAARLRDGPELHNHIGTMHAGALFTLGETASGAAMAGSFAAILPSVKPVAAEARIQYLRAASGPVTAVACVAGAAALVDRLLAEKRIRFEVDVNMTDETGAAVADMTVHWHLTYRVKGS